MPAPYKEGSLVFGPGKTSLLFHKDEDFTSELLDLYLSSIMSDNSSELAWSMSTFQYYKIVRVDVIVNPSPSLGKAYIGFYWNNQVFSDAIDFTQSDTTKVCVFPSFKPKVFTYYPVNAIVMDIGSGYNYRDWIPTTQTTFPGKMYYINDGTNANFRVQVLIKFRGSRAKTVNSFINMFNKFSSSKLILQEKEKEDKKEEESEEEINNKKKIKIEIEKENKDSKEKESRNKSIKNKNKFNDNKFLDYFD